MRFILFNCLMIRDGVTEIPVESIPGILETGYTPPQAKNIKVYIYPNIPVESILGILETGYTPPRAKTIKVYIF